MPLSSAFHESAQKILARYPVKRSALIMLLHEAQDEVGYLSTEAIREVADVLDLTPADVAGVATFYTMFKRRPPGTFLISLCTNVGCGIRGADDAADALRDEIGPPHGSPEDGLCSWEPVECLAYCSAAPAAQVNYRDIPYLTPQRARALVDALRAGKTLDEVVAEFNAAGSLQEAGGA